MKRHILLAAILFTSCHTAQIKRTKLIPKPKPKISKPTACEIAMKRRPLVEKVLGKWHEKGLKGIRRIYFLEEPQGSERASFTSLTRLITITATPQRDLEGNIDALDHEIGHSIYNLIQRMKGSALKPIFDRLKKLQKEFKGPGSFYDSKENLQLARETNSTRLFPNMTVGGWKSFLGDLLAHPDAQCIKSYLQAYYIGMDQLREKTGKIKNTIATADQLSKDTSLNEVEVQYIRQFLDEHKRFVSEFKKEYAVVGPAVIKSFEETGRLCKTGINETFGAFLTKQNKALDGLLHYKAKIMKIKKRRDARIKREGNLNNLGENLVDHVLGGLPGKNPDEVIKNEIFARAVDSLMDLYFGPPMNDRFQLNETILSGLEKITIDNVQIFAEAVSRYRKGLKMLKQGFSPDKIRKIILSSLPTRPYPKLFCAKKISDVPLEDMKDRLF
jgi:hypothetical protein